jgi:hypothetical protein
MTKLNNLQLIASCINGHNPFEDESGAICDYYYELETEEEKIQSIKDYGMHADVIKKISDEEAKLIYDYLESDYTQDESFHAFKKLGQ